METIIHKQYWKEHRDWFIVSVDGSALVRLSFYYVDNSYWINDLFVNREFRHRGYASTLLDMCEKIAGTNEIHIVPVDENAKKIYTKRGYIIE